MVPTPTLAVRLLLETLIWPIALAAAAGGAAVDVVAQSAAAEALDPAEGQSPAERQARAARDAQTEALVEALEGWVDGFEGGSFGLTGAVQAASGNPGYVYAGRRSGALDPAAPGNHLSSLYRLMAQGEANMSLDVARAMLRVASVGIDRGLYNPELTQVRDLGHWTLMRCEDRGVWFHVLSLAAGDRAPWSAEPDEKEATRRAALQVAALRLLGQRNRPVFRATVEGQLQHADSRVRLAAAEAVAAMGRQQSVRTVAHCLRRESHPVVAGALVRAGEALLKKYGELLAAADREEIVRAAVSGLGLHGWRYDLQAIELAENWPYLELIPVLILTMERAGHPERDAMLAKVGKRSSLRVRSRAWQALQGLVGTFLPENDPEAWREFWTREKDNIVLRPGRKSAPATGTRATFYGIPIEGSEVGFLVDTSGSMDTEVAQAARTGPRAIRERRAKPTRLELAKEQIVQAVEHMDPEMRYHLFTFADGCWVWNERAVPPTEQGNRALAQALGRFEAKGGTNLWVALIEVLEANRQVFGQESENPIDELFVLSDGEPSVGETSPDAILEMVRSVNQYQRIKINVVFTGEGKGSGFLQRLAAENDGVFVQR